jgi:hypothetical protein
MNGGIIGVGVNIDGGGVAVTENLLMTFKIVWYDTLLGIFQKHFKKYMYMQFLLPVSWLKGEVTCTCPGPAPKVGLLTIPVALPLPLTSVESTYMSPSPGGGG